MANKPKWQRARLLRDGPDQKVKGKEVWAQPSKRPHELISNILSPTRIGKTRYLRLEFVELLPEFADDVPLIPWEEFIRQ